MLQAGFTAALGIKAQQQRMDVLSGNVANVNTNGYKSEHVEFRDALYETLRSPVPADEDVNLRRGHGAMTVTTNRDFTPGIMQQTGSETDFYLDGEGFFAIGMQDGRMLYTRDGGFQKSVEADGAYLVTAQGNYVLDVNGNRIRIQGNQMYVSRDGMISAGENTLPYAQIQIVRFENQKGLEAVESNLYQATAASGAGMAANGQTEVIQKAVEGSNVNLAEEFTALIRTQKAFAFASRALSQADEMDGTANALR